MAARRSGRGPVPGQLAVQSSKLVDDIGQPLRLVEPVEDCFDLAADDGERGAELVTEIGEQSASSLILLLETGCHPVERAAHRGEGTGLRDRDSNPGLRTENQIS